MRAGNFNINDYLDKLYEAAEEQETQEKEKETKGKETKEAASGVSDSEGLILPEENKKTYNWLKKEYNAGKTEVKVEMKMGGAKFEPGYDLQTDLKSVNDFKPGMFGEVKTVDTPGADKTNSPGAPNSPNLTSKGGNPNANTAKPAPGKPVTSPAAPGSKPAAPGEKPAAPGGAKPFEKGKAPETSGKNPNISNKEGGEKEEGEKTEVKKVDLKTKKK